MTMNEINQMVRKAIKPFYPTARVHKGKGTACGWCRIHVDVQKPLGCTCTGNGYCPACNAKWQEINDHVHSVVSGIPFYRYYDDMNYQSQQVNVSVSLI